MRSATSKAPSLDAKRCLYAPRIGLAKLSKAAFDGGDLRPLWHELMAKVAAGKATAGDGLDLSVIAQLLGDKDLGLEIQSQVLAQQQLFRPPCASATPRLRVLALATAMDMGGNTPIEFLLEDFDIELMTLYIVPGIPLPEPLPDHDIAIVISSDSDACREALVEIARLSMSWPRPLLNVPGRICNLDRDKLHRLLSGVPGLAIPATARVAREQLSDIARSGAGLADIANGLAFPITARPTGSHAGFGLSKLSDHRALEQYLLDRPEPEFFVSQFIDYASDDGLFRKYRITFVDGRPYAVHMAISEQWSIWYLNAEMKANAAKRAEEAEFMRTFDEGFAARHRSALAELAARVDLDYFTIDCAETKEGNLLIFEADNTSIVHNMDPPEIFPYKPPQMRKIFAAFAAMLTRKAGNRHADA
jgi:hypothetical protein